MGALLRRLLSSRKGAAAVEFAAVAPVLVLFSLGLADFGLATNERIKLSGAARAGAQVAVTDPTNIGYITQTVQQAASLSSNGVSVTVSTACGCSDGTAVSCGSTCSSGQARNYVTVNVAETYPLVGTYPGLGSSVSISANATLRYY